MDPERLDPRVVSKYTATVLAVFILVIPSRRVSPTVLDLIDKES